MGFNVQTKKRYHRMKSLVENSGDKIILDIGAGQIPISRGIKSKKTIILDGIKKYKPDICCNINKGIPLKDNSIDIVLAGEIIEHLFSPFKFIREIHRILKKGGVLILSTPNTCSFINRIKMLLGDLPAYCAEPLDDESFERHIADFNLPVLIKILEGSGFKIAKKTSNGVIFHSKSLLPEVLTPPSMGETLIIKAVKNT